MESSSDERNTMLKELGREFEKQKKISADSLREKERKQISMTDINSELLEEIKQL